MRFPAVFLLLSVSLVSCQEVVERPIPLFPQDMPYLPGITEPGLHYQTATNEWNYARTTTANDGSMAGDYSGSEEFTFGTGTLNSIFNDRFVSGTTRYVLNDSVSTQVYLEYTRFGDQRDAFSILFNLGNLGTQNHVWNFQAGTLPATQPYTDALGNTYDRAMVIYDVGVDPDISLVYVPGLGLVEVIYTPDYRVTVVH